MIDFTLIDKGTEVWRWVRRFRPIHPTSREEHREIPAIIEDILCFDDGENVQNLNQLTEIPLIHLDRGLWIDREYREFRKYADNTNSPREETAFLRHYGRSGMGAVFTEQPGECDINA